MPTHLEVAARQRDAAIENWREVIVEVEGIIADNNVPNTEITEWYHNITESKKEAQTAHFAYIKLETNAKTRQTNITEYNKLNKRYIKARTTMMPRLDEPLLASLGPPPPGQPVAGATATSTNFHDLPKLTIPQFDGDFLNYQSWRSMFMSTIAPFSNLDDTRKLSLLLQALTAPVRERFDAGPDSSYTALLAVLDKFFGSSYRLAQEVTLTLTQCTKVIPTKQNEYQRITNLTRQVKRVISNFKGTNLGELLVMSMLENKLPEEKRHQFKLLYASTSSGGTSEPVLNNFLDYVENLAINQASQRALSKRIGMHAMTTEETEHYEEDEPLSVGLAAVGGTIGPRQGATQGRQPVVPRPAAIPAGGRLVPVNRGTRNASSYPGTGANAIPLQPRSNGRMGQTSSIACAACGSSHPVYHCRSYLDLATDQRWKLVSNSALCYNCLFPGHAAARCASEQTCKTCQGTHHTTLHREPHAAQGNVQSAAQQLANAAQNGPSNYNLGFNRAGLDDGTTLLMTASVSMTAADGAPCEGRALVDPGAEDNIVTEEMMKKLMLAPTERVKASFHMVGGTKLDMEDVPRVSIDMEATATMHQFSEDFFVLPFVTRCHRLQKGKLPSISNT